MKYTPHQIDEISSTLEEIKLKRDELDVLENEVKDIDIDTDAGYLLSFNYKNEERLFEIPSVRLIYYYNVKITNLKLEIESLEKRLQELVK